MDDAACKGMGSELFVLSHGSRGQYGKKVCEGCPVREDCEEYADRTGSVGIWGGKIKSERTPRPNRSAK